MPGLWRCHAALQEIILALEGEVEHTLAFACQTSEALYQVTLGKGDRSTALPMIPVADILPEPQLGKEEVDMKMIRIYKKALCEIKTQPTVTRPRKEQKAAGEGADGRADLSKWAAWLAKQKLRAEGEK